MNKQDMLKIQTCVLRVNIHCEGCMHKVKKKLQKVEGVYKVSIDSEQGKVIVSGNADPASLIEKLEKAGKHAEIWGGPQKAAAPVPVFVSNDQFKKFQMESAYKNAKKGNHEQQHKNGNGFAQISKEKAFKDDKLFSAKDHKSVKFNLPEDDEFDDDEFDEDDDEFDDDEEFDDESEDELDAHKKPAKAASATGVGHKPSKAAKGDKDGKAKKGGGGGGGGIDMFIKSMLKKAGRKKGDSDEKSKKGDNKKEDGGKNDGKKGGFEFGDLKKGKNDGGRSKKGGEGFHGGKQQQQKGFNDLKANHKGVGGGGMNMDTMGQKGGFPSVAGIPAMNGGGFGQGNNPYSQQQQYMAHMMMMNQNGHGGYHPSAYARPPPPAAMSYGPPPPGMVYGPAPPMSYGPPPATTEHYTNMFSDENADSCSIM